MALLPAIVNPKCLFSVQRESMDHLQYNQDGFKVSPAAMKARISARTEELAVPKAQK